MKRIRFQIRAILPLLLFVCGAATSYGQFDRATISGTIADSSGAVIPGVQVIVTSVDTGANFTGSTNSAGIYTVPGLPVGTYALKIRQNGFQDYAQTGIILTAAQVLQINVQLTVGANTQTVTVTGGAPLLETETSTVSTTMEQSALRDLPLNATNGRDAMNLLLATTPAVNTSQGGQAAGGTQNWNIFAGGQTMTNSVYVDGMEATAGNQGQIVTPGLDALQEVQVQTLAANAEFGTGGGVEMFQIKSGTNQFHGSAFEFLQNEDLNSNTWSNNQFLSQCAPSDTTCISQYARARDRFNDYGLSAGGPIWKARNTFIFGDFERYSVADDRLNPNSETVPTPQMLTGDFSQLLTGGTNQGDILTASGIPWINPCTGSAYQYGQIFDPATQKIVNGQTCATPFPGNIIPQGRLSTQSQKIASIFSQYYKPTISSRIYNNFPSLLSGTPSYTKTTYDLKVDHNFSQLHHLSVSFDAVNENGPGLNGGLNYLQGPFSSWFSSGGTSSMVRVVDNYSFTPNLLNTFGIGFSRQPSNQQPYVKTDPSQYGFNVDSTVFPVLNFGNASNGVGVQSVSTGVSAYYNYNAFHYQDTVIWTKGRHSLKFGGTFMAQQMNASVGGNVQNYQFASDTGGPTDPGLTPFVGSGFATAMLGAVQSANEQITQREYPRQKTFALFVQDDYKASPKLTLNLGLRWDVTLPGHEQAGRWQNFDITAQNPLWGSYPGAWVFSKNSGTTFETNQDWHQFGPRIGAAYSVSNRLVARAAYGLFYVPLGAFSSGYGPYFPANQTFLAFPTSQVLNNVAGATAFNWDGGYPGVPVLSPQNSTATYMGTGSGGNYPMYIHPDLLHLGYTQNWHIGAEYEMTRNTLLSAYYMGNRGRNLHDDGRGIYHNYPDFGTYQQVLLAGNINTQISNAGEAAAIGVPYPYAGFNGPAYAAIAPFPQVASYDSDVVMSFGNPADGAVSAFNAFIIEGKARNANGFYVDFSYTLSKMTGSAVGLDGFANNWGYPAQNLADIQDAAHWVQNFDQRHLAKGYVTYALPFGRNRRWLAGSSTLVEQAISGWELGYYGSYGSGTPLGPVQSTYQLPYFFSTQRANFMPGQDGHGIRNQFGGHLNLSNLSDSSNTDFNRNLFTTTNAAAPFGDTPYTFNHWRWNPGAASENLSAMKHFQFGPEDRLRATIAAQFFNVFNRHYFGAPDTNLNDTTFGQVTGIAGNRAGISGNRIGQLSARFEW